MYLLKQPNKCLLAHVLVSNSVSRRLHIVSRCIRSARGCQGPGRHYVQWNPPHRRQIYSGKCIPGLREGARLKSVNAALIAMPVFCSQTLRTHLGKRVVHPVPAGSPDYARTNVCCTEELHALRTRNARIQVPMVAYHRNAPFCTRIHTCHMHV